MPRTDVTMHTAWIAFSLTVFLVAAVLPAEEPAKNVFGRCILPLGMEEGKIPDDAITASSSYETKSVGPQNARIRQEKNGGAWCPKAQISSAIREFLEVDLTRDHLIAWTETQGRFGNGQGQEYAEAFFLEYWRDGNWHQYKNLRGDRVLRGNSNTYLVEKQKLDLPFVASRVRFVPYSQHPRTVCMRVEIYGCVWEQHVARYSAPKGSEVGPSGRNVEDSSYDGTEMDGTMRNGLGQLTDGILGEDSEILANSNPSSVGTNWLGWADRDRKVVELLFEFDELREFENCSVHVAAIPQRGIEVFSTLRVWFSLNGRKYQSDAEKVEIRSDAASRTGVVSIALRSRVGRFLKLELELRSEWLLISEVTFETATAPGNLTSAAVPSEQYPRESRNESVGVSLPASKSSVLPAPPPRHEVPEDRLAGGSNETSYEEVEEDSTPDAFPVGTSQTYVGLVSGLLTVLVLLFTCTTFLMKQRGRNKVALLQKHTALLCGANAPGITINVKDVKLPNPVHVNGSRLSLECKSERYARPIVIPDPERASEQSTAYEGTYKLFCEENAVCPRGTTEKACAERAKSECGFVKDVAAESETPTPTSTLTPYPMRKSNPRTGKAKQKVHEGYYAATDILTIKKREESPTLSLFTPLRIYERESRLRGHRVSNDRDYDDVQRVSRHRLRILDKLGEGSFGLVHLCEAKGIQSPDLGTLRNRQIVIVRSLWRGVVDSLRKDFTRDMRALARIRDPNIARIIALVEEEPFGAVFEYGELGDLPSFMERREKGGENGTTLCLEHRLTFFAQIAAGLKYLESLNVAHCDVAARNCVVGKNFTIKVSDHAVYLGKYDRQYYVDASYAKIPLRWMSWESVLLGKCTCRADVWSYAVTVWEILTNCEELPYSEFTSEQVLENCNRWYNGGATQAERTAQPRVLPRPTCCPDDLYATMIDCWSVQPEDRPTFREIYQYFERLGYA